MARIAELAASRLRARYEAIATELGHKQETSASAASRRARAPAAGDLCAPHYLHGLLCFRAFHDHEQIASVLGEAEPYELARGSRVPAPDEAADELLLVVRGGVEVSVRRAGLAQRVRLAGPGRFVGHVGVLGRAASPVVADARERVVLIALPGEQVRRMLRAPGAAARRFSAALTEDVARALRQAERPMARTPSGLLGHSDRAGKPGAGGDGSRRRALTL